MKKKVYSVAIGNFSLPPTDDQLKVIQIIKNFKGFIALIPESPKGTLLIFDTLNNAKEARNIFKFENVETGYNIVELDYDDKAKTLGNGKVVA